METRDPAREPREERLARALETLGVGEDFDAAQLKAAYRNAMGEYHRDKVAGVSS